MVCGNVCVYIVQGRTLALDLSLVSRTEHVSGTFTKRYTYSTVCLYVHVYMYMYTYMYTLECVGTVLPVYNQCVCTLVIYNVHVHVRGHSVYLYMYTHVHSKIYIVHVHAYL